MVERRLSGCGKQRLPTPPSLKQCGAEPGLELPDMIAHRHLRQAEQPRRGAEPSGADDDIENFKLAQRRSFHVRAISLHRTPRKRDTVTLRRFGAGAGAVSRPKV